MTMEVAPGREQEDNVGPPEPVTWRRRLLQYGLYALIPFAMAAVFLLLAQMASSAAAATGGCGGG